MKKITCFLVLLMSVFFLQAQNVAEIGTTTYPSLQAALDSAHNMTGDVTIELLKNIEGYSIVHQKADLNLTIEGNNDTIAGQIIVEGDGRAAGTEKLTIRNVTFCDDGSHFYTGTDAFVLVPSTKESGKPWYTNKYNYAHNITVSDCEFTSTSSSLNVVGFKANSGAGNYNTALTNVTGDNLHSLAQFTGTTGATITNCKVPNGDSFINVSGGAGNYVITDCKFVSSVTDGYGIRDKDGSSANFTIERDTINASKALVFGKKASESPAPSGQMNVASGVYDGTVEIIPTASTATFSFTGGTYTEPYTYVQNFCAPNYIAYDADPESGYCTVRKNRPVMSMDSTDVVCFGENNGTDTVRIQGGVAPFQLVLSSSVLDKNDTVNITDRLHIYTNLKPGSYLVELTDAEGETATGTFTIKQPDSELEITALNVPVRPCPLMGSGNYTVSVEAQGGNTGPYSYVWGNAATNANSDVTTVVSGTDDRDSTYTVSVTVKDSKNCSATATETFTVSAVIANDGTIHSNSKLTIDTIRQGIYTDCDTIIRDYGTPVFTTTIPEG